jgi:hypothetical protein
MDKDNCRWAYDLGGSVTICRIRSSHGHRHSSSGNSRRWWHWRLSTDGSDDQRREVQSDRPERRGRRTNRRMWGSCQNSWYNSCMKSWRRGRLNWGELNTGMLKNMSHKSPALSPVCQKLLLQSVLMVVNGLKHR